MTATASLSVRAITMRFGGVVALDDVGFEAHPGTVLGVMGPNGAGKTTLFNIISGVQQPTGGSVHFGDARLTGRSVARVAALGVTRTFQTPVMFWGLTVRESIEVALAAAQTRGTYPPPPWKALVPAGFGAARRDALGERAAALLAGTRLEALADRATDTLAFGEERLLELLRALAVEPSVLLLDEPLSGLNPDESSGVLDAIRAARARGICVLLVEHAVGELLSVADRVVVLDHGKKIAEGDAAAVAADPVVIDAYIGDELA